MRAAFSLVELSIVLVILGLLTGGILGGQSLIRAAELRSVATEYSRYVTAVQTFRDKYFAVPGDMPNATQFWGDDNAACPDGATPNGSPGTCNGNGDGFIGTPTANGVTGEMYQNWKQMALAGLIEGTYTGIADTVGVCSTGKGVLIGTNAPRSRLSNAGWSLEYFGHPGDASTYTLAASNLFFMGGQVSGCPPINDVFKPEELWNIDTKLDDGKPGRGKIMARSQSAWGAATSCTLSASSTDYNADYRLSNSAIACSMLAPRAI